jgi:AraC-like DNA-binding protein
MQAIALVRTSSIRPVLEFRERTLGASKRFLSLPQPSLRSTDSLIPLVYGGLLWEETARASGIEALGLRIGEATRILEFGEWGSALSRSLTVGAALETATRVSLRFNSGQRLWIEQHGDEVWFHRRFCDSLRRGRQQVSDFSLMLMLDAIRLGAGRQWRPSEIHFDGDPPRHADELQALAEGKVCFGQPSTALVFPRRVLALPFPANRRPSRRISRAPIPSSDFADSVRQAVGSLVGLGLPQLELAAEVAGTSERSFQRRLAEVGLSFGRLVEEARFEAARRMLRDPGVKIIQISTQLGYRDSANFTRAFRRWTGVAPQVFRRVAPPDPRWEESIRWRTQNGGTRIARPSPKSWRRTGITRNQASSPAPAFPSTSAPSAASARARSARV